MIRSSNAWIVAGLLLVPTVDVARGAELSAEEKAAGFVSIFDGASLAGWVGATDGYGVKDGAIVCLQEKGGNLFHEKQYADFVLRFEVLIPPGGNNGIAIRSPQETGNLAFVGSEIQVLDDPHPMYAAVKDYQHHGSVYGVVPAKTGALKPAGEWNVEEITVQGRHVKVVLNGTTIVDADLDEAAKDGTLDGRPHPGLSRTIGYIGFLGHGSPVAFRNLRIKDLLPADRRIDLTIEGAPDEAVQVWYRGDMETGSAPLVFTGKLGVDGRVTITVPRVYVLVGRPTRSGGIPMKLHEVQGNTASVKLSAP